MELPQNNVDNLLNPESTAYKPDLVAAIFFYRLRSEIDEHFWICIQMASRKDTAWKYTHQKQVIFDGTFGVCNSRLLLFIALSMDEAGKGVPLTFFLFSTPTGNRATHASYNMAILHKPINVWKHS
jgi:hypothetical protein